MPDVRDPGPQEPIGARQPHPPRTGAFQDLELVAQGEDLELQRRPRAYRGMESREEGHENGPHGSQSLPGGHRQHQSRLHEPSFQQPHAQNGGRRYFLPWNVKS